MSMNNNIFFILKFVWKKSKSSILVLLVPSLSSLLISVTNVWGFRNIIQVVERKGTIYDFICSVATFLLLNLLSDFLFSIYHNYLMPRTNVILNREINIELMQKVAGLDIRCFDDANFYNQYTRALSEANSRIISLLNSVSNFLGALFSISALISMIMIVQPIMVAFTIVGVILGFVVTLAKNKVDYSKSLVLTPINRRQGYINRVFYQREYSEELRQMPSVVKLLINDYKNNTAEEYKVVKKYFTRSSMLDILKNFGSTIPVVTSMLYIAPNTLSGKISVGNFIAAFNAVTNLTMQLSAMLNSFSSFNLHSLFIENFRVILEYKADIEACNSNIKANVCDDIIFDNVNFKYPNNNEFSLKNINMRIKFGDKIALVGYNGAGKTTLIKLLIRLYDPSSGEVRNGGHNLKDVSVKEWRKNFGLVFQKYQVYAVSVAENVLLRRLENKEDEMCVISALEKAGLLDDVLRLPNGIKTVVTKEFDSEGVVFSGGQLHKLALARIYASNKSIVILDEPTASLDPYAEYKLNQQIQKMETNKTVIVVSHRLSCTSMMDKIYFMENGMIKEQGTHTQLMRNNRAYAEIYKIQKKGYEDSMGKGEENECC